MSDIECKKDKTSFCRLPKVFNPDNYLINLIIDLNNLKYKLYNQMDLSLTDNKSETGNGILIINCVQNYKITNIFCLDEKKNLQIFENDLFVNYIHKIPEENKCLFFHSKDLIDIVNNFVFKFDGFQKYQKLLSTNENQLFAKETLKYQFIKFIQDNSDFFDKFKNSIHNMFSLKSECFDYFEYMLEESKNINNRSDHINQISYNNTIKEQTIYIKLPMDYSVNEKIKVLLEIEGDIRTEKSPTGFNLSIWGENSSIFDLDHKETIRLAWKNKIDQNKETILLNSVFAMAGEPVEFRTVFPCFDEPCFKSRFSLNVFIEREDILAKYTDNFYVLSNGDLIERQEFIFEKKKYIKFKLSESPLMSIYLLTWIIGYYDCLSKDILI